MKFVKQLLALILLLAALPVFVVQAEGGVAIQPYWTFPTDAPVTHIQTGDINGDGAPEVVMTTADGLLYVLKNDGRLAWRYELGTIASSLAVADWDGDGKTAEIFVGGETRDTLLSDTKRPLWTVITISGDGTPLLAALPTDMNRDGRPELLVGTNGYVTVITDVQHGESYYETADISGRLSEYEIGRPVIGVWAGEIDGVGRPEVVPSVVGGKEIYVLKDDLQQAWQQSIEGQVGLVQAGDVDGDGKAEVVALSASWDLYLFKGDGKQLWRNQSMSPGNDSIPPAANQMLVCDLDGDGRMEIIVLSPGPTAAVHVFKGDGSQFWQQPLGTAAEAKLAAADVNGDGQAEVVVAMEQQVTLLDAAGHRLAEYHPGISGQHLGKATGALAYADLNGDGQGEIIVGTETGLQVFGAARQVERQELWRSSFLRTVTALGMADLDGDGPSEVLAGSEEGQIYALAATGQVLWQVDLKATPGQRQFTIPTVLALSAGDVDGDGQQEVVAASSSQIYLLNGDGLRWAVPAVGSAASMIVHDVDNDGRAEIIAGGHLTSGGGIVTLWDGAGKLIWQQKLAEAIRAVGSDGGQILAGTDSGRVYRLTAGGAAGGEYELGARVLSFGAGLAATTDGKVYRLNTGEPALVRELNAKPRMARLSAAAMAMLAGEGEVSLVTLPVEQNGHLSNDGLRWQGTVDGQARSLAVDDLNGDGQMEVAVGTDNGQVHLFGLAANQPPLLTNPGLVETRTGYVYGVDVNDPEDDTVTMTIEIWDPSAGVWLAQPAQPLAQGQGRLNFNVADPFDTWDSGQESRFRFRYDDGHNQGVLAEVPGPFSIPTLPWYIYHGQWAGLGVLLMLPVTLGFLFYRRQRTYRNSPVGRAESLFKQLLAHPDEALPRLHDLARHEPGLLAYLPSLAREAGETAIADRSEGFQLILTRPEVAAEGLRAVVRQGDEEARSTGVGEHGSGGDEVGDAPEIQNLYGVCLEALEANTVSRIVSLQARLDNQNEFALVTTSVVQSATTEVVTTTGNALTELGRVAQSLHNYERVETVEDKIAYLAQALEMLGRLDRDFQITLAQPERNIFSRIALNWLTVTANTLEDLQGRAQIEASLKTRQVLNLEQATLSLELTNTGHSPASNLTISLSPDQHYAVGNGAVRLDILPAGRSVVVELLVSAAPSVEQFRAEFVITFDDRERSGKRVAYADMVRLLKPNPVFQTIPNPYAPGTPLRPGSPIFFGRDDLFHFMTENLAGATRQNMLVLIGQRRMGKTSFLQQLPAQLGQAYLPVYLDGQSLGVDPGMANFFYDLSLAIADAVTDHGCAIAEPVLAEFQERPSAVFERTFLPAVFEAIGSRRLLLLFDEFEELEMRVASGNLEASIFSFFRHLMQHVDKLGFVFIGTHRLEELTADYWSILFNIALYKHVTFLSEGAARALIVKPVAKHGLLYDDLALDKMIRVTAGHPYFLQLICHALVNRANRDKRTYLTIRDVNDTLAELVELGEAHFAFLWEQSSPAEQLILAALIRLLAKTPTVTAAQIVELLIERGRNLEVQGVREALRRLTERGILHEVGESPPRYEYKVDIIRLWMESYKVLGRVIEEIET